MTKIRQHARETGEFCNVETDDMKERSPTENASGRTKNKDE